MRKRKTTPKPYWDMNADELARATAGFDAEFVADQFGPPPPAARATWRRAKRGRPRRGQGVRVISLSIERGLLRQADATAHKHGLSRAELISRCLRSVLSRAR